MPARKATTRKFTARQLANQRRFAAMAKARSRAAKKKRSRKAVNPHGKHLAGATPKQQRQYEAIKKSERKSGKSLAESKRIAAATVRARAKNPSGKVFIVERWSSSYREWNYISEITARSAREAIEKVRKIARQHGYPVQKGEKLRAVAKNPARRRNKTIIKARTIKHLDVSKVHNPKTARRKYRNGYLDLVIMGHAKKTPDGWVLGGKTFKQGKGIVPASRRGYYLDKATGTVFSKKARNIAQGFYDESGFHPIRASKDYEPKWAGEWGSKKKSAKKKVTKKRAAKRNPSVKSIRKTFAGTVGKASQVFAPIGTPKNVAKLGKLVLIETEKATIRPSGVVYLCADTKGKLHLCGSKNVPLYSGPAQSFGKIAKIEYAEAKKHLYPGQGVINFWHKMGEENGVKPTLYADGKGGLKIRGGQYRITGAGLEN
jgi:hypothetical protein